MANISARIVLGKPFLTLSNTDVPFIEKKITWRSNTTVEALPTTKRVELIDKKEFAKAAFDKNSETFVIYVVSLNLALRIHLNRAAQIFSLLTEEVKIPDKYSDFANVYLEKKALILQERTKLNEHAINLENGKQLPYRPIYNLGIVELKILKIYIEIYLKTGFIWPFKSPAGTPILFDKQSDGSLCLCIDYQSLNNLMMNNQYPLPLIRESLDWLG